MAGSIKWKIRQFLARHGVQVTLEPKRPGIEGFLRSRRVETVLDVGANVGQFALQIRNHGYEGRIISFEPVSSVYEILAKTASLDPLWQVHRLALGDVAGSKVINVSKNPVYSSLIQQTSLAVYLDSNASTVGTETISVSTLDDIFEGLSAGRTFLKIDTQGFEQSVIAGASKSLKNLLGVQLELPIEHLYSNTWTIDEAIRSMREQGFILAQTNVVNMIDSDPESALELDCIFRRAEKLIDSFTEPPSS